MSKENAQKLFNELETNKELREKLAGLENPADIVKAAVEAGYEITEAELIEAEKELRKQRAQKTDELSPDELESASGGTFWQGEDAPDGREMGCFLAYHDYDYQWKNKMWCANNYWCERTPIELKNEQPDCVHMVN